MRRFVRAAVVVVVAGCGGRSIVEYRAVVADEPDAAAVQPDSVDGGATTTETGPFVDALGGSRLRPVFLTSDDGARQMFSRWRDTKLDLDCEFWPGRDGVPRCVPTRWLARAKYFTDDRCTQRVAQLPDAYRDLKYAIDDGHICAAGYDFYRVGEDVPLPIGKRLYAAVVDPAWNRTGCEPQGLVQEGHHYKTVVPVDPDDFVAGPVVAEDVSQPIGSNVRHGSDGSREWISFFDTRTKVACLTHLLASDGVRRCLPDAQATVTDSFLDPSCSARLAVVRSSSCGEDFPPFALRRSPERPTRADVFTTGPRLQSGTLHRSGADGCQAHGAFERRDGYVVAEEEVPPSTFVPMLRVQQGEPSQRLRPIRQVPLGQARLSKAVGLYDGALESECEVTGSEPDGMYCVPIGPAGLYWDMKFTDPDCTNPVAVEDVGTTRRFVVATPFTGVGQRAYRLDAPLDRDTVLYGLVEDGGVVHCRQRVSLGETRRAYALVEVPFSTFVRVTATTE